MMNNTEWELNEDNVILTRGPRPNVCLPSLTGIAGFFCLRPKRMKKRTSGMKISKASTHWRAKKKNKIDIIICAALPNTQQFQCSDRATRSTSVLVLYHDWLFVSSHLPARGSHWGIDWVCLNIDPSHQEESERYVQSAKHTVSAHGCHSQ